MGSGCSVVFRTFHTNSQRVNIKRGCSISVIPCCVISLARESTTSFLSGN